jgi:anti-sigma factor RsiW
MGSAQERDGHVELLLGAYVLGGLSGREAAAVRAHLLGCASCQAEHDELAAIPSWLDLLAAADDGEVPG